jgi:hypothetical protein
MRRKDLEDARARVQVISRVSLSVTSLRPKNVLIHLNDMSKKTFRTYNTRSFKATTGATHQNLQYTCQPNNGLNSAKKRKEGRLCEGSKSH